MFKKAVRISVDICPTDKNKQDQSSVHTISIVLESGECLCCSWSAVVQVLPWANAIDYIFFSQLTLFTLKSVSFPFLLESMSQ